MTVVLIGLGSNLGERIRFLDSAVEAIRHVHGIHLLRSSSVYDTEPVDFTDQPRFLNQVVSIETSLAPHSLLSILQSIENRFGRKRTLRKGPRTLDLDILLYDGLVMEDRVLSIPHPELLNRSFFIRQILEIEPETIDPVSKLPLAEFLDRPHL